MRSLLSQGGPGPGHAGQLARRAAHLGVPSCRQSAVLKGLRILARAPLFFFFWVISWLSGSRRFGGLQLDKRSEGGL